MKKYFKIFTILAAMALLVGSLSACSLLGPRSAEDCFKKNISNIPENYHMNMDMDLEMEMGFNDPAMAAELEQALGSKTISLPIKFKMEADAGKETAHADLDMSVSMMGQKTKENGEMYVDGKEGYVYTKEGDSDEWTKNELENKGAFSQLLGEDDLEKIDWEKAKFEKTDSGYVVTFAAEDIGDLVTSAASDYLNSAELDEFGDFEFTDGDVVFTFDKKCRLVNVNVNGLEMKGTADIGSGLGDMDTIVTVDVTCAYSKFNEVEKDKYEIPEKVIKNAVEGDSGLDPEGILEGGDDGEDGILPTEPTEPSDSDTGSSAAGSGVKLSQDKIPAGKYCFVVGKDIKAGTYKIYANSGSGTVSIQDAETYETNYDISMGFELDTDTPDGTTVVLDAGDEIYIAGDLVLEFR